MLKTVARSLVLPILLCLCSVSLRAQADEKKFEVGGQYSLVWIQTRSVTSSGSVLVTTQSRNNSSGFGGRFGYQLSKYFTLETEVNFFPRDRDLDGGRKLQGLFGVKGGKRFEKFGVFAKARPGFVRHERGDYVFGSGGCPAVFPPPLGCFRPVARTNFALDLGGVVELYPSKRTIIRFDAGDTMVHLPTRNVAAFQASGISPVVISASPETKHNFQGSVGFGFRF
jgi:hypothetical protein